MTSAQVRAARGLLNWTVRDLAKRAGIHRNTVTNIETERYGGSADAIAAIRSALEAAGVEFIPENGGGAGVRLSRGKKNG
ncbi:helix-turn-helix transcriptional regulator [Ruegeria pomeroyi]|uniref:helix-turn-helix transcriptional regulator n=1 Tax=Ruegeria pomeroyi TaxID=89184 RepID=UPI001F3C5658|nr:helix-turn-helix transcriptional regulator [Ruegeria pomeroyi]MCE8507834.1 helix-turn-helix transcriptional regulator [Ruegeria pomeroyi]